jgi:hypothetical protein
MPPLLAALLMMEFGCTIDIVQAIDLNVEWLGHRWDPRWNTRWATDSWYQGYIGMKGQPNAATYWWPQRTHPKY